MKIYPANISFIGKRSEQQDRLGWYGFNNPEFIAHGGILGYVCDGMGGMKNGGMAASVAGEAFVASYRAKSTDTEIVKAINDALGKANLAVCNLAKETGLELGDIGTTLAAIVVHQNCLYWISVGDSRVYLLRDNRILMQITTDHTYALRLNERVIAGEISQVEANLDPDRESLISYLGQESIEKKDISVTPYKLEAGDKLLVCSDGIHGFLDKQEITECLCLPPNEAVKALESAVLAKGDPNQDNFSALVLAYEEAPLTDKTANLSVALPVSRFGFFNRIPKKWFLLLTPVVVLFIFGIQSIRNGVSSFKKQEKTGLSQAIVAPALEPTKSKVDLGKLNLPGADQDSKTVPKAQEEHKGTHQPDKSKSDILNKNKKDERKKKEKTHEDKNLKLKSTSLLPLVTPSQIDPHSDQKKGGK